MKKILLLLTIIPFNICAMEEEVGFDQPPKTNNTQNKHPNNTLFYTPQHEVVKIINEIQNAINPSKEKLKSIAYFTKEQLIDNKELSVQQLSTFNNHSIETLKKELLKRTYLTHTLNQFNPNQTIQSVLNTIENKKETDLGSKNQDLQITFSNLKSPFNTFLEKYKLNNIGSVKEKIGLTLSMIENENSPEYKAFELLAQKLDTFEPDTSKQDAKTLQQLFQ